MSAQNLISLASSKGYRIGRKHSGVYYYGAWNTELSFFKGTWSEFVGFVKSLPDAK